MTLPVPAKEEHIFSGWFDNAKFEGEPVTEISATDTGDKEFWAKWTAIEYAFTIIAGEGGEIELGEDGMYAVETSISIIAKALTGYVFKNWTATAGEFEDASSASTTFTMPSGGAAVTAIFERIPITSLRIDAAIIETVARGWRYNFGVIVNEGAIADGIVWTIANPALAHVDEHGTVTIFERTGTVVLMATDPVSGLSNSIMLRIAS